MASTRGAVSFQLFAVCDTVPNEWHGEARFGGHVILRTGVAPSEGEAARLAEQQLVARIVKVFSSNE